MTGLSVRNVAIVGAAGRMGSHIVTSMLKEGKLNVTAITRNDSDSTMPAGIAVKRVDYEDPSALADAMTGQDALIITLSGIAPPSQQLRLVEAAAAAKVRWIMPNWYSMDGTNQAMLKETMVYERTIPVLRRIEELGVSSWVCLVCGFWYEWSLSGSPFGLGKIMYGFDLKARDVTFIDDGTTKINTTTWPQAGLAVARLFALKETPDGPEERSATLSQFRNGWVYVSSFLASQKDMFESCLRVTGTREADWTTDNDGHEERYEAGMAEFKAGNRKGFAKVLYTRTFYPGGDGDYESKHGLHNDVLGLPEENLDDATRAAYAYAGVEP